MIARPVQGGAKLLGAALWAGVGRLGRAVAQILFMLVLGRAIGPAGFASASISLIGYQMISTFAAQSFSQALIRDEFVPPGRGAAAFWLNIGFSGLAVALIWAGSGQTARMLGLPDLVWLLPVVSAMGAVAAPSVLSQADLSRQMAFRLIAGVETVSSLMAAVAGGVAVWAGWGLVALVVYAGVQRVVELLLLTRRSAWRPTHVPDPAAVRDLLEFTLPLMGMQVLSFANGSIDQVFVAQVSDPARLGLFGLARRLTQQPTQMIAFAVERAVYPALIHARRLPDGHGPLVLNALRWTVMASSLPLFLLAAVAPEFVSVVLGPDWSGAGAFIALFACSSAVLPVGGVLSATLRSAGLTRLQLMFQLIRLMVSVLVLAVLGKVGASAWQLAIAVAILSILSLGLPLGEVLRRLPIRPAQMTTALVLGLWPAAAIYAVLTVSDGLWLWSLSDIVRLGVKLGLGMTLSALVLLPALRNQVFRKR